MNKVTILIDNQEVSFSNLELKQEMCALHFFSFNYQIIENNGISLDTYKQFYKDTLSKAVSIKINDELIFEGQINQIICVNQYQNYVDFLIQGNCNASKLDQLAKCKSFTKLPIKEILSQLLNDIPTDIDPILMEKIYLTTQYNVTSFKMAQVLCKRYGEWMYYDVNTIRIKKPDTPSIPLQQDTNEVFNIRLEAKIPKSIGQLTGYDFYSGKALNQKEARENKEENLFTLAGANQLKPSTADKFHHTNAVNDDHLTQYYKLKQAEAQGENIHLKCSTNNPKVRLGSIIEIKNKEKTEGTYIVTKVQHNVSDATHFVNEVHAVPIEMQHPPYTNPDIKLYCPPQYAIVTSNEDKDGLSRIKVRFNWQDEQTESTWMNVMIPHAGKEKGFRFLPEKDDEVLVNFIGDNPDLPYVAGAVYTEKNNIPIAEKGNHIKSIRTRSQRRIDFDDDNGLFELADNSSGQHGNAISMQRKDGVAKMKLLTGKGNKAVYFEQDVAKGLNISVEKGDEAILHIYMDIEAEKITIKSKKDIEIQAKQNLNLKANDISFHANKKIKMECDEFESKSTSTKIAAIKGVDISSDTSLKISGMNAKVDAQAELSLSGGIMSKIKGGIVMIN